MRDIQKQLTDAPDNVLRCIASANNIAVDGVSRDLLLKLLADRGVTAYMVLEQHEPSDGGRKMIDVPVYSYYWLKSPVYIDDDPTRSDTLLAPGIYRVACEFARLSGKKLDGVQFYATRPSDSDIVEMVEWSGYKITEGVRDYAKILDAIAKDVITN